MLIILIVLIAIVFGSAIILSTFMNDLVEDGLGKKNIER